MSNVLIITRRELGAYFSTSLAAVFLIVFVAAAGALTFLVGDFFAIGQANLVAFFTYHPWLFLVLVPAVGMRLWSEERRLGTIEFLMTLPVSTWEAVLSKFLAAWVFIGIALFLTFPIWITVNYLGSPDNGVIVASYLGSFLMAGGFLAITCCVSALTGNQVTAFVISVCVGLLMLMASQDAVLNLFSTWAPAFLLDLVASLSFARHFDAITRGVVNAQDILFYLSLIALFLFTNKEILDWRRGK